MKKSIFLFFAAILYATSALGIGAKQCYVYFDNSTWNATNMKFVFWQDKGSNKFYIDTESMTTLSNTQLKYVRTTDHSSWSPAIAAFNFLECANASDWGDQELTWSNFQSWAQTKYTAKQSDWDFNGGYQLFTGAQTEKNKSVSGTYNSGYANLLQKTHTLKVMVSTDGGATYEQATTSPATVTCQTYIMKTATATSSTKYTIAKDATTTSNASVKAIYTAKTTLKAENIADGYTFVGWYDATNETMISTSATPSAWYPKEAITLEARFSKEEAYPVTISYMCGSEEIESPATITVGVSTASAITAPVIAGYNFSNWTLGSGVQSADANANPISITTKASGDYTLTANYSELPKETVYFINTNEWTGTINAYAWTDGTPKVENAGWAGLAATKEDFQIGGYDVYSYTATAGTYANVIFNGSGGQTADLTWQAGKYYAPSKSTWYDTKEAAETALAAPVEYEYVYLINTNDWAKAHIYTWTPEVAGWPGAEMTKEATQIAGKDVYSYKVVKGTTFGGMLFNNGDGSQTGDLTWQAGKYYAPSTGEWYADAAAAEAALAAVVNYDYYLTGSLVGGWDPKQKGIEKDGELYKATFTDLAAGEYEFKITKGDWAQQWNYSNLDKAYEEVSEGKDGEGNPNGNIKIVTTAVKTITVNFDATANKISLEGLTPYVAPLTYTVTVPAGTEKCYIAGAMNGWNFQEMTATANANEFTIEIAGARESDGYKYACKADWDYVEKKEDGNDLDANRTWTANDVVAKWGVPPTYTIVGATAITGANWDLANAENIMAKDGEAYTLTKTGLKLETGDYEYKVAKNAAWGDGQYPAEGNQKVTITETAEYTIVYTYTVGTSLTAVATKTGEYTPAQTVYTVAGAAALCGSDWKADDTTNDMTDNGDGTFTWEKTDVKLTSNVGFKVVKNHDFGNGEYPAENWNINLVDYEGAAVYTVTITFTESSKEIAVTLTKTGEATPPVITYVLMGVNGDWDNGIALTQNPDNADEYVLENQVIIKATDAVKVVTLTDGTATAWCGNVDTYSNATYTADAEGNIVLEDGIYTFYFKKNDDLIYINQTGYVRNVTNKYGTICLPYASASTTGATFYRVAGKETGKVYLESVDALEAGVPYIFEKTANQIKVVYTGEKTPTAASANGLVGTFEETTVPDGDYILYNNAFCTNEPAGTLNKIRANRAYLDMDAVTGDAPQQLPGRRYIGMSVQGENEATGFENITAPAGKAVKAIVNGQLIIIRNGEKFNAQGVRL